MERDFFIGLPEGKTEGICQMDIDKDESASKVDIPTICRVCPIGKCVMFEPLLDEKNNVIGRKYIEHPPAYKQ